jgi:hypothetical protein
MKRKSKRKVMTPTTLLAFAEASNCHGHDFSLSLKRKQLSGQRQRIELFVADAQNVSRESSAKKTIHVSDSVALAPRPTGAKGLGDFPCSVDGDARDG